VSEGPFIHNKSPGLHHSHHHRGWLPVSAVCTPPVTRSFFLACTKPVHDHAKAKEPHNPIPTSSCLRRRPKGKARLSHGMRTVVHAAATPHPCRLPRYPLSIPFTRRTCRRRSMHTTCCPTHPSKTYLKAMARCRIHLPQLLCASSPRISEHNYLIP
jgi:hypothetical protein